MAVKKLIQFIRYRGRIIPIRGGRYKARPTRAIKTMRFEQWEQQRLPKITKAFKSNRDEIVRLNRAGDSIRVLEKMRKRQTFVRKVLRDIKADGLTSGQQTTLIKQVKRRGQDVMHSGVYNRLVKNRQTRYASVIKKRGQKKL